MLKMVDGTGIIGVDMICPLGVSTPQPPNYDKVELEGAGMLVLPNSLNAPLERLELGGKTEQNQDPPPSPEYLQEIKNAGKWNEETQKYEVDVKVTGKNLFDKSLLEGGKIVEFNGKEYYKYIDNNNNYRYKGKFKNGQQYAFTLRILRPASKESNGTGMEIVYTDGTRKWTMFKHGELKTLVSDPGKTIDYFCGGYNYGMDCYLDLSVTRLSVGGQDAGYAPYKEQTLTITSDRPITKWDRLVEQGGEIGWLYGSVIATIDETSSLSLYAPNGFFIHVKNIDKKEKTGYCDKLYTKKMSNGEPFVLFGIANNNFLYTLNTQEFYGKTPSEIKAKLKEYPLNIIGKSETTEFIPLQQSEQNAIRALKTYYPTTVITADGGELDPDIKVTYRKEI